MLESLWNTKIQVIPVLLAVIIFIIPSVLHRLKKEYYVPVYFSVFPFNVINKSLSTYLVDDYFGENMTDQQAESYRSKLIVLSAMSLAISVIIIPGVTGFLCTFFLSKSSLLHFLIILSLYLLFITTKSVINFKYHSISSKGNKSFLVLVYFFYIGMVINVVNNSYYWAIGYTEVGDWAGLLSSLSDFIFNTIGIKGIMLILITGAFSQKIFDRKIRKENIEEVESWRAK